MFWSWHCHLDMSILPIFCHDILIGSNIPVCMGHCISLVGRRGYRALPGNQFLIDVSRLEKYHRKRFAMLKS